MITFVYFLIFSKSKPVSIGADYPGSDKYANDAKDLCRKIAPFVGSCARTLK